MNSDTRVMFYYPYTAVTPAMSTPKGEPVQVDRRDILRAII